MSNHLASMTVSSVVLVLLLSGCGGSGSGSGGGGGGGGSGGYGLSISLLAPSSVTVGIPTGGITIYGQGFTSESQVLMDGQPIATEFTNSTTLTAEVGTSVGETVGTHQFTVQNGTDVSNALTFTTYLPQQGPNVMQAVPGFLVGEYAAYPSFIVAADVNGDGLADVIMPGPGLSTGPSIAILDGQTNGTLAPVQYISVPTAASAVAVGDVDGNGTPDLVYITTNNSASTVTVSVLSGDGHGNFQAPVALQTFSAMFPAAAQLVDLDGDGQLDLVLSASQLSASAGSIVWLKNTGGGFAAPVTLAPQYASGFALGDINGDGKEDIVYATPGATSAIHILFNQGNGTFKDQAAGGLNGVTGVPYILDFNLDGIPDLVVVSNSGTLLNSFAGHGDGTFTQIAAVVSAAAQLVTGDFDHDGFPDLAGGGGLEPSGLVYFFGDGTGNFVVDTVVGPEAQYAAVGDFNGDGIPDVVMPDNEAIVTLSLGRTDRNFPSLVALTPANASGISTGAINTGGLQGIFLSGIPTYDIPGTFFLNQGNESFALYDTTPSSLMVADLTGRGVVDLLGGTLPTLEIWPNNGTPSFLGSPITIPNVPSLPIVADMDGDGYPDMVTDGQILYGNGAYQFTPVALPSTFTGPYAIGDFNGDGRLDILDATATYFNMGNRVFQLAAPYNNLPLSESNGVVVADFNGDGKDDVAINLPGEDWITIYFSRGDGTFYEGTQLDAGQEPGDFVAGDFNGDGLIDLAIGLITTHEVCIFFNTGQGQFTRSFFASGALTVGMTVSDLNHAGKLDLVIANFPFESAPPNVNVMFHQ
jgi:hypothetical protein